MILAQLIAGFFRITELQARAYLSDVEMADWMRDRSGQLDWGTAW